MRRGRAIATTSHRRNGITVEISAGPATASVAADGSVQAKVADLARVYGNLFTDLQPSDLQRIGVERGDSFLLTAPGGEFHVLFGTTYADVPEGDWIAFPAAEGTVMIARNCANAASTAGLEIGDPFSVAAIR